jgi:hypothetical protein
MRCQKNKYFCLGKKLNFLKGFIDDVIAGRENGFVFNKQIQQRIY